MTTGYYSYSNAWAELVTHGIDPDRAHAVLRRVARRGEDTVSTPDGQRLTVTRIEASRFQVDVRESEQHDGR